MAYNSSYPQTPNAQATGMRPFIYEQQLIGTSDRMRTQYPMAQVGEIRDGGAYERVYAQNTSTTVTVAAGAVACTITQPTFTTDASGFTKQTAVGNAVVAAGTGWTSAAAFAPGDFGWLYKLKTL
jgi:hypothetical protein